VRASLEGVNAASSGLIITAAYLLFEPIEPDLINLSYLFGTFFVLAFTKIPTPVVVLLGLVSGLVVDHFI